MLDPDPLAPRPLDADLIRRSSPSWSAVTVVEETGSTNADLADQARTGAAHRTVLVAASQRAGRGRRGRSWASPPGGSVAMSVLLRPERPVEHWSWLPLLAGLAVADGLSGLTGLQLGLKWPNDVLVEERKLCGVLLERVETAAGPASVLGIGINVDLRAEDLPVPTATSLRALLGSRCPSRSAVVIAVLAALDLVYGRWVAELDQPLQRAYRERSATVGRAVRVHGVRAEVVEGTAETVDDSGRLVVGTAEGARTFHAGDVVHLR